jgi:hypothetical protein
VTRYYDLDAANARLEEVRPLLEQLRGDRDAIASLQAEVQRIRGTNGSSEHHVLVREHEDAIRERVRRMEAAVAQLSAWDVTLRDIRTGLIDFPALANGRPIWLCWRLGEGHIDWWHELDAGFNARKRLAELT